jgi:hypothetical protein
LHIEEHQPGSIPVFDDFVYILWGKALPTSKHHFDSRENLDRFQYLLRNLISTIDIPVPPDKTDHADCSFPPRTPLQASWQTASKRSQKVGYSHSLDHPTPTARDMKQQLQNNFWKEIKPSIIILTGTMVFGAILAFILCAHSPFLEFINYFLTFP